MAQANEPDNPVNTRIMTPASHQWAHEYGGIYTTTGTVTQLVIPPDTWVKITGTFQNAMLNSGSEINCDWNDDRIVINEIGTYLLMYHFSIQSLGNAVNLDMRAAINGVTQPQVSSNVYFGASGTVGAVKEMVGIGIVPIISGSYAAEMYAKSDVAITFTTRSAQLVVEKLVG